jgi:O-antigen ligase
VSKARIFSSLPLLLVLVLLPFFEGGETSIGLFLLHTIILLGFSVVILLYARLAIPRSLTSFLPFLFILLISTLLSDYKYAAFLKLWDFVIAAVWAMVVCTLVYQNKSKLDSLYSWIFIATTVSTVAAILIYNTHEIMRISASFVNPNNYASFALILLCFGFFSFEREIHPWRKTIILTLLIVLLMTLALSFSRGIFVALLAVFAVLFLKHRPSRVISGILLALVLISGIMIALRFRMYEDPLRYYRLKIWKSSIQGVFDSPYLGVGLGMLEYQSNRFNFPADTYVGRYAKIARSADNQYIQVIAETGFLGFFAFVFWWIGLAISIRKFSHRFFYLALPWLVLTITCLFSLPLQNTSILLLFFFLLVLGETLDSEQNVIVIRLSQPSRALIPVLSFVLFLFFVNFPYIADHEFYLATRSQNREAANNHLVKALRYNPYQPYYRFFFLRQIVDAKPNVSDQKWTNILVLLNRAIELNPQEYQFYLYKARVLRILIQNTKSLRLYPDTVSAYQNALGCNPYNVFLRLEFASVLARFGRYDLAESEAKKSLELEPAFLNARLFLTEVLFKLNRSEEAKAQYNRFETDVARFQGLLAIAPNSYIRELLTVNQQQKEKIEQLTGQS